MGDVQEKPYSWLVCIMAFISNSLVFGFHASYGSIFVAITDHMGISETVAAWIGSISFGLVFLSASFSSLLCHRYGCRAIMLFGTLLYSVGMISSTFVVHPGLLFLTYSITIGFGSSCVHFSCLLILRSHFTNKLSLASGIVASGSGIGGLAINPIMGKLLEVYGLQKSLLIYSSTSIVLYITGMLFRENRETFSVKKKRTKCRPGKEKPLDIKASREPSLFCNGALVILTISHSLICFGFYIPQVHLIRLALLKGVPYSKATLLPGYISAAQALGKILFGKLSDWPRINRLVVCQLCLLVTTVANSLAPLSLSYAPLTAYAVSWGFCDGAYNILVIFLTGELAGTHRTHAAYGFACTASSVFMLLGPPVASFIHSTTGSYETVFFLSGGNITLAICLMFLIPWLIPKYVKEGKHIVDMINASLNDISHTEDELESKEKTLTGCTSKQRRSRDLVASQSHLTNSVSSDSLYTVESQESRQLLTSFVIPHSLSPHQSGIDDNCPKSLSTSEIVPLNSREARIRFYSEELDETGFGLYIDRAEADSISIPSSSSWASSSCWRSPTYARTSTGSDVTNSDSGIYGSARQDSILVLGHESEVTTKLCNFKGHRNDKGEPLQYLSMNKIGTYVGTLLKGRSSLQESTADLDPMYYNRHDIVVDRVTCL